MNSSPTKKCRILTLNLGLALTFGLASSHFQGRSFIVAFPSKTPLDQSYQQYLSFATAANYSTYVNVTVVKNSTVFYSRQIYLSPGQGCFTDCHNTSLTANLSRGPVVSVTSTNDIVVLAFSTSGTTYSDYFLLIPVPELSKSYLVVAECPASLTCVIIVASGSEPVTVNVTFVLDAKTTVMVSYNNIMYYNGSVLRETLDRWSTMEIQALEVDLSGSVIASTGPVAVLSGTETVSANVVKEYNVEELIPVNLFDTEYVVIDCPIAGSTTYVRVIYAESNTTITVDSSVLTLKTSRNRIQTYTLKQRGSTTLHSNMPVIVQLVYGGVDNLIMQPVSKWARSYVTVPYYPCNVLLILRSNCTGEFLFNGKLVNGLPWTAIGDGTYKYADLAIQEYGSWLNITADCTFDGIVYSTSAKSYVIWSLGWGPEPPPPSEGNMTSSTTTTPTTTTSAGQLIAGRMKNSTSPSQTSSASPSQTTSTKPSPTTTTAPSQTKSASQSTSASPSLAQTTSISQTMSTSTSKIAFVGTTSRSYDTIVSNDSTSPTTIDPSNTSNTTFRSSNITTALTTTNKMAVGSATSSLCPCTCRFALKMAAFPARQGELADEINGGLLLEGDELSAQKRLKITSDNWLISEQVAGCTIVIVVLVAVLSCLTSSDVIELIRLLTQLVDNQSDEETE